MDTTKNNDNNPRNNKKNTKRRKNPKATPASAYPMVSSLKMSLQKSEVIASDSQNSLVELWSYYKCRNTPRTDLSGRFCCVTKSFLVSFYRKWEYYFWEQRLILISEGRTPMNTITGFSWLFFLVSWLAQVINWIVIWLCI